MSRFFKALKQAERDRALLEQAEPPVLNPPPSAGEGTGGGDLPSNVDLSDSQRPPESSYFPSPPVSTLPPPASTVATPNGIDRHLVSLLDPTSFEAEQYRGLRHIVEQIRQTAGTSVVGVTSAAVGDGKTITAINLAGALAQAQKARVLLIETDMRRPSLARYLGLSHGADKGLVDAILKPEGSLDLFVTSLPQFGLAVLPAGRPQLASYELLKSPRLETLLGEARKWYDYIVLDTPPLIPLPDCRLLLKLVDTLILVVAAHQTPRKLLEEALNLLEPEKVLGIVFNNDDRPLAGYYYRYEYHQNNTKEGRRDRTGKWLSKLLRRPRGSENPLTPET